MSNEDQMSVDERYKYLRKLQKRYQKAKRKERSKLLDEMEEVTNLHRKSIIRLMGETIERKPRKKQRGKVYGPEVKAVVSVVAESLDWICAERIQPTLLRTAEQLARHGEVRLNAELKDQLGRISISTVRRMLATVPRDRPRLYRRSSQRANRLAREIPAGRIPWDIKEPGHFEADLVHHSGPSASGQYVHSLQMVDAATGWSERAALLGRGYLVTKDGFERLQARIPFLIREVHPDNGPEFLNQHVVRYWGEQPGLILTRSRPWQKNDNRFVEQKNATLIRAYLGNDRLDTVAQTDCLNQLYVQRGRYYNLFQPVMRLAEKTIVHAPDGRSVRVKRRFDDAQTPFDRLCATGGLDPEHQQRLETLRDNLNPRQLRRDIYALLDRLFALPGANPDHPSQDVYLTLFNPPDPSHEADSSSATDILLPAQLNESL
jgi:hypothetical protein